mmetsp:Transcript_122969/g.192089  ORF Transcript_122969/g.192089 Transcript_122969/m.192089 type:complete len:214 (-) Transcript_122969:310-951(-)
MRRMSVAVMPSGSMPNSANFCITRCVASPCAFFSSSGFFCACTADSSVAFLAAANSAAISVASGGVLFNVVAGNGAVSALRGICPRGVAPRELTRVATRGVPTREPALGVVLGLEPLATTGGVGGGCTGKPPPTLGGPDGGVAGGGRGALGETAVPISGVTARGVATSGVTARGAATAGAVTARGVTTASGVTARGVATLVVGCSSTKASTGF